MRCPNCKTNLPKSTDMRRYQDTNEHCSRPNATPSEKFYWACPNKCCVLHEVAFWDNYGDYYSTEDVGHDWYRENCIDCSDPTTHNRKGCAAIGSESRQFTEGYKKNYVGWTNIKRKIKDRIGNWSCELRRLFNPDAIWRDNSALHRRLGYSLGILVMDFWGQRWKIHCRWKAPEDCQDDHCIQQWLHHPMPWVRWRVQRWLDGKTQLR